MRNVTKLSPPTILVENKAAWDEAVRNHSTEYNKNKYRHREIKDRLLQETNDKCVYCESKIGHNCPGDIEHKIPKSKQINLIFDWENMTIACNECNRRKSDYYDPDFMFLDPNSDDVENRIIHLGPLVFNKPGDSRSAITVLTLEIDKFDSRTHLIARKIEMLEHTKNLIELIAKEQNQLLRQSLIHDLRESCSISGEFSGMLLAYVNDVSENWQELITV